MLRLILMQNLITSKHNCFSQNLKTGIAFTDYLVSPLLPGVRNDFFVVFAVLLQNYSINRTATIYMKVYLSF